MIYTPSSRSARLQPTDETTFGGEETGFIDNFSASFKLDVALENSYSEWLQRTRATENLVNQIKAIPGHENFLNDVMSRMSYKNENTIPGMQSNVFTQDPLSIGLSTIQANPNATPDMVGFQRLEVGERAFENLFKEVANYVEQNEEVKKTIGSITPDRIKQDAIKLTQQKMQEQADVYRRATGVGVAGGFIGTMGAVMTDPINVAAMVATRTPAAGWFRNGMREAVASATAEGAIQKGFTEDWYKELGLPYTQEDFITRIGFAGGAGFVFGGGAEFISERLRKSLDKLDQQRAAFNGTAFNPDRDRDAVFNVFAIKAEIQKDSPIDFDPGQITHLSRESQAYTAIVSGDFSNMPIDMPFVPKTYNNVYHYDLNAPDVELLNTSDVLLDPKLFQVKRGRPKKIQAAEWNPTRAGTGIVYRYRNGDTFVVDGHGRIDLAKRISKKTKTNIQMPMIVLREANGISLEQAKARGAGKNLAEGTLSKADLDNFYMETVKVKSKIKGEASEFVQKVTDMTLLSDKMRLKIHNGEVDFDHGSIIARLINNEELQEIAANILAKQNPTTLAQAEAIVRQVQAKGVKTMNFKKTFGEDVMPDDLYKEKAVITEQAILKLTNDRFTMQKLIDALNLSHLSKEQSYGKIIQIVYGSAFAKGNISDAITNAARRYASKKSNLDVYARELADSIRGRIEQRDYVGLPDGSNVSNATTAPFRSTGVETSDERLKQFSDDPIAQAELYRIAEEELRNNPKALEEYIAINDVDANGNIISVNVKTKDILDEINSDAESLAVLRECSRVAR